MNVITSILLVVIALILLPAWVILLPGLIFCGMLWFLWKAIFSNKDGPPAPVGSSDSSEPRTILEQSQTAAEDAVERARKDLGF